MIPKDDILIHRYELTSRSQLNARSDRKTFSGALVRLKGHRGAGCIHPWTELGDDPLDVQLEKLKTGNYTNLIEQALTCAKSNLWQSPFSKPIPPSHYTVVDPQNTDPIVAREAGFTSAKLKGDGRNLVQLAAEAERWIAGGLRLRIDFNETATVTGALDFWKSLANPHAIDFLEDPLPWDRSDWEKLKAAGIPLGADRDLDIPEKAELADWWIVKPALVDPQRFADRAGELGKRMIITTYMDHGIGQLWAMHWAAKLGLTADCGLMTHALFSTDPFFECIKTEGAHFSNEEELPALFCDELDHLNWESL